MSDTVACAGCGQENPAEAQFCNQCGARLDSRGAKREERKLVSVLFVDLVGFTARSDRADPEDVRDTLQLYYERSKERIELYGGIVEKFIGDAVMAVFGAEVSHGDDAERAVRAGLAVLAGIDGLNAAHGLDLAARAAVNTGEAMVALGGGAGDALALGDVVNTASRLQSAAPVGGLIVGADAYRASRHAIRYAPLTPIEAKGKGEPVAAWIALGTSSAPSERPIAANPLVGRSHEVELMRSVWERAVTERRPHLVTVLGPPGIGKSRLCREVSALVEAGGGRVVRGRCLPYEEQTGYQAFATIVRQESGIFESDPQSVAYDKLQLRVGLLLPEAEAPEIARHLALLIGVSSDVNVPQPALLFFAARRFLECLGEIQATLVVFEDIHWAQSSELELLAYLAAHVRDAPIVLVAVARPELVDVHPSWGSGLMAQTTIPLEPLSPTDAAALASHVLGGSLGSESGLQRIVEVAEGNPLFVEELASAVGELPEQRELPVTVRAAIASRIDALPAEARSVLLAAAVVGKTFWWGVLRTMEVAGDLDGALAVLEARNLVRREASSQVPGDVEFSFRHILIREVAFGTVPRATRRRWHAAVADQIEQAGGGSTETLAWILAHHWREAGEPTKAVPHLLSAAAVAQRGWAKEAAVDLYTQALELAETDDQRRQIRLRRGSALLALGDLERASAELGALLPELTGKDRLEALLAQGRATHWLERDAETLEIAEEAVALATELVDREALPAALALQSQAHGMVGEMDLTLELGERALAEWIPGTRADDLTNHLHLHADFSYWAGRYERSGELSREARAFAVDVRSPEALIRGGGTEALALAAIGRHEDAIRIWDELFALVNELGRKPLVLLNYSSLAYREVYDLDEARRRSAEALELSQGESFGMPRRFASSDLLLTDLLAGDIGHAQAVWPVLWSDAESATAWTKWLIYGRLATARAEIALAAESPESAVEWAMRALEIARRTRRRKYEARASSILGEALARMGRREEAVAALRQSVAIADELIGPPARWAARLALVRGAYALGEDGTAAQASDEAVTLIRSFAGTLAPERAARLLSAPPITEALSLMG
jgi:class 3 adenylate cyclase/tetratricopeptide (TPR) repeat protein